MSPGIDPDLVKVREALEMVRVLETEKAKLLATQERHLRLIQTLSRAEAEPRELEDCRRMRASLIAEVGTLRSENNQLREQLVAALELRDDALNQLEIERRDRLYPKEPP